MPVKVRQRWLRTPGRQKKMMEFVFVLNSLALGAGLAMDAFSVSLANGLHEPRMPKKRMVGIAAVYAVFQYAMPLIGWVLIKTVEEVFSAFHKLVPWIALLLLLYIGGKMLLEGLKEWKVGPETEVTRPVLGWRDLLLQGIATSIDALSVGFTLEEYSFWKANSAALMIGGVTFLICLGGILIGRKAGTRLSWGASVLGGVILIAIGIEIFVSHLF